MSRDGGEPWAVSPARGKQLTGRLGPSAGLLLPAVFSVCLASAGSSIQSVVVFLVLTNATTSFCTVGMLINPLDIAPR